MLHVRNIVIIVTSMLQNLQMEKFLVHYLLPLFCMELDEKEINEVRNSTKCNGDNNKRRVSTIHYFLQKHP